MDPTEHLVPVEESVDPSQDDATDGHAARRDIPGPDESVREIMERGRTRARRSVASVRDAPEFDSDGLPS